MHTGSGRERWMLKSWEEIRKLLLRNAIGVSEDTKEYYEIDELQGRGNTDPRYYIITVPNQCNNKASIHVPKRVNILKIGLPFIAGSDDI